MKTKIKGNQLLCADFKSPDHPYATFDDGITDITKHDIMLAINFGSRMIEIYGSLPNWEISNVMGMLVEMDKTMDEYYSEMFAAMRMESEKS